MDWEHTFQVNLMPGFRLSQVYVRNMLKVGWGRIVFLSSVEAINVTEDALQYSAATSAVLSLSRGLAKVVRDTGVTVNSVLPGVTASEWLVDRIQARAAEQNRSFDEMGAIAVRTRYPTAINRRIYSVEEVANLVVYACSPQASATTGSVLRADGGIVESIL
jgi:NAD(P)-dependent dehydrogenase (short-subunit alcohol dehydrogenase family)